MTLLVWVQGWQMQCCGEPFAVGDNVQWTLDDEPDHDWLGAALGADLAHSIGYFEEHHGGLHDDAPETSATVVSIKIAWGSYAAKCSGGKDLYPVPGSQVLTEADRVDGTERDKRELRLNGYVVELRPRALAF